MDDTDLVEMIDQQLAEGEKGGDSYPRCPHCGRHWHYLPLTARVAGMYALGVYDPAYAVAEDDSPLVCQGSEFIGPMPEDPLWYGGFGPYPGMGVMPGMGVLPRGVLGRNLGQIGDAGRQLGADPAWMSEYVFNGIGRGMTLSPTLIHGAGDGLTDDTAAVQMAMFGPLGPVPSLGLSQRLAEIKRRHIRSLKRIRWFYWVSITVELAAVAFFSSPSTVWRLANVAAIAFLLSELGLLQRRIKREQRNLDGLEALAQG